MARYSVLIKTSAAKELEAIPRKKDRRRLATRIAALADDPRPPGCQKLSARERYRIRQGRYRIVYAVDDSASRVEVFRIGDRKSIR